MGPVGPLAVPYYNGYRFTQSGEKRVIMSTSESPLSFKSILSGIIVTVVGGIILAYILQNAKLAPNEIEKTSTPTKAEISNWNDILSARMPTLNEIRVGRPISIWDANFLTVRDMHEPGFDEYFGTVQVGREYLVPVYWCTATASLLAQNTENIETSFLVNDEIVPEKYIFNYNYDMSTNWKCNYHAIILGGWIANNQYVLQVKRKLLKDLSDGQLNYSAGEYIYRLTMTARK